MGALRTAVIGAGVFAGTNLDDIIVLTVLFLSGRATGKPTRSEVWAGHYIGTGVLVVLSLTAALGLVIVAQRWVGLLGLVPIAMGGRGLVAALRGRRHDDVPSAGVAGGLAAVVGVTITNGADNISVYTPLFRSIGFTAILITVAVFGLLAGVWCAAGLWVSSHRQVVRSVERYGHWIVPGVFVLVGAAILIRSGLLGSLIA